MPDASEPTLRYVGHDEFLRDVEAVAAGIEGFGWRPHYLVGIGRGGLVPAAYLSHRLDIPMLSIDHSSKLSGFGDELIGKLATLIGEQRRILFIDDINDSGSTISQIRRAILGTGASVDRLRFAVLIDNRRSITQVDYRARTIDRDVDKEWIVFPWEAVAPRSTLVEEANEVPERLA